MSRVPPSGQQVQITAGDQRAVVVEVGGGLRSYEVAGRPVLDGYAEDEMATAGRGQLLVPWPNRLHGGEYTWDGRTNKVPLNEPAKGNASHGLCRWVNWVAREVSGSAVTMQLRLHPSPAYPFTIDLAAHYSLDGDGLTVTASATNVGDRAAPYAQGAHPYLTVGGLVDEARLTLPARTWMPADEDQIPTGREPVHGTVYDFRRPRPIGDLQIDYAFTDLERGPDGRCRVVLAAPAGDAVELWVDEAYPYLMVFTGDGVPQPERRRHGLAVEPMSAPPNAFVTGEDVTRLEPGATVTASWGIRAIG